MGRGGWREEPQGRGRVPGLSEGPVSQGDTDPPVETSGHLPASSLRATHSLQHPPPGSLRSHGSLCWDVPPAPPLAGPAPSGLSSDISSERLLEPPYLK